MPELFQNLLSLHLFLGMGAIFSLGYAWMTFKDPDYKINNIKILSVLGTLAIFSSWVTGGYYYLYHYGSSVKPAILAGSRPWAHRLIMEAKEHIFLILPFLAIVTLIAVLLSEDKLKTDPQIKKYISALFALSTILSILMMIMGFIISSAK